MSQKRQELEGLISEGMDETLIQTQEVFIKQAKPEVEQRRRAIKRIILFTLVFLIAINLFLYAWLRSAQIAPLSEEEADAFIEQHFGLRE